MQFLDRFTRAEGTRLMSVGHRMRLSRGDYLIRRGERSGDLYLVETGALEVVDTRSRPEIVLDVLGPGSVVGEMGFMDQAPRAADVRATVDTVCRWWDHAQLLKFLHEYPVFAASFYRALAGTVVGRARSVTTTAVTGAMRPTRALRSVAPEHHQQIKEIAVRTRTRWFRADTRLGREPDHAGARAEVHDTFRILMMELDRLIQAAGDADIAAEAANTLHQELSAYLGRSRTVSLVQGRQEQHSSDIETMAHILGAEPGGDGPFGEELDRAILQLPTCRAFRLRQDQVLTSFAEALIDAPPRHAMVLNGAAGGVLPYVSQLLEPLEAVLTCIEGDRETLSYLHMSISSRLDVRLVHDDLARVCFGRATMHHEPQDLILVDGLVEYLPDRMVAALLNWCHDRLRPGGSLLVTALRPETDSALLRGLLSWPTVRRTEAHLLDLLGAAGLHDARSIEPAGEPHPGIVATGVAGIRGLAREDMGA